MKRGGIISLSPGGRHALAAFGASSPSPECEFPTGFRQEHHTENSQWDTAVKMLTGERVKTVVSMGEFLTLAKLN